MLYFANPCGAEVREAMETGELGMITTPAQGNRLTQKGPLVGDNGCFGKGYPGDPEWLGWLKRVVVPHAPRVWWATAPDVVGNATATIERSGPWLSEIRKIGLPAAFVGQDGLENLTVPWPEFDVFFIGGSTEWKLGEAARELVAESLSRGKKVHMGRVNSKKRWKYAESIGCHSVDGTFLVFAPKVNLPRLREWLK